MVGVPRSQGCRPCRRKKKGCDLAKPTCAACQRLNIECMYEERKYTFVTRTQPTSAKLRPGPQRCSQDLPQNRSLSRTALEIQIIDDFWARYLPQEDENIVHIDGLSEVPWQSSIQNLSLHGDLAPLALAACAYMSIGRLDGGNQEYVREAQRLYGRCLQETNIALRDTAKAKSDCVLASCKLLGMYENFRLDEEDGLPSTQGTDWRSHVEGMCRLVELRGPEMASERAGHDLYLDVRVTAAIAGIAQKRPKFFATADWQTKPWQRHRRTTRDELIDIMASLPQILQRQEVLYTAISQGMDPAQRILSTGTRLLSQCISLGERLLDWENRILSLVNDINPLSSTEPPSSLYEISKSHGLPFFHLITQFWVTSLMLYSTTHLLHRKLTKSTNPSLPTLPIWLNPQPYASNIARTASHFFAPSSGLWGAQISTYPIGAAMHYLVATNQQQSPEMQLLKSTLRDCDPRKTAIAKDFLRSIAADAASNKISDARNPQEYRKMASEWYDSTTAANSSK